MWIPTNRTTGVKYPPITDEEKAAYLADPNLSKRFTFTEVKLKAAPAPEPIEAKKVEAKKD